MGGKEMTEKNDLKKLFEKYQRNFLTSHEKQTSNSERINFGNVHTMICTCNSNAINRCYEWPWTDSPPPGFAEV
jgi:hypothetical protein